MRSSNKIIIITGLVLIVISIFLKNILSNETVDLGEESAHRVTNHVFIESQRVKLLKDSLIVSTNNEKYSNFALQLSTAYLIEGKYDSAAKYKELVAERFPKEENWISAGLTYYKAFENASGEYKEYKMAIRAIECLEKGTGDASTIEVKLALARLYIAIENPVKGIDMLHKVILEDSNNIEALYLLSIKDFQLNNIANSNEYLKTLVRLDSTHVNGMFYLAVCQLKLGNIKEAKVLFEKVKLLDSSEEVKANAESYLDDIK